MPASTLEPIQVPTSPENQTYRFSQWLHDKAEEMRFRQTSCWLFLADQVESMAQEARLFDCDSPDEFLERQETMDRLSERTRL